MTAGPLRKTIHRLASTVLAGSGLLLGLALQPMPALVAPAFAEIPVADGPPSRTPGIAVPAGQVEQAVAQLDTLANAMLERSGIPGLAVAVVHGGQTVYAKGFGLRHAGAPEPVDADTVFQIASLSKPVGASVVAGQVAAGTVAWDSPVREHLPWFALADEWVSARVTIGDLYAHRSGLPDHAGDDLEDLGHDRRTVLERLRLLPLHPFRAHYAYTNFGLTAAAEAVAQAAGQDWATLSAATLYRPLGMDSTSSRFADFEGRANRAHGHVPVEGGFEARYVRRPDAQSPAGGVSSNVRDMARWMAMILQQGRHEGQELIAADALLPAITAQMISDPSPSPDARPGEYGFGFGVGVQPSGRVSLSHSGAFALGWASNFVMLPSLDLGIVLLSNAAPVGAVEALGMAFADLAQYGAVTRDWYAGYSVLMAAMLEPVGALVGVPRPADPAPPGPAEAYAGTYGNAYFGDAVIAAGPDGLHLSIGPDGRPLALAHWDGDTFTFQPDGENAPRGSLSRVDFLRQKGDATALTIEFLDENGLGTFRR